MINLIKSNAYSQKKEIMLWFRNNLLNLFAFG